MNGMELKEMDRIIDPVCKPCRDHERTGFVAGVKIGVTHLFFCVCEFHCFADGNKRLAITLSTQFLLINGYMAIAKTFLTEMENISYHVATGNINKVLLQRIMTAIMNGTYSFDEELKLDIYNAIL